MTNESGLTGLDLKLRRVAVRVQVKQIAEQMGITASRVSRIEGEPRVTPDMEERYMRALEVCGTFRTSKEAA